jgi:hypothetical protein
MTLSDFIKVFCKSYTGRESIDFTPFKNPEKCEPVLDFSEEYKTLDKLNSRMARNLLELINKMEDTKKEK